MLASKAHLYGHLKAITPPVNFFGSFDLQYFGFVFYSVHNCCYQPYFLNFEGYSANSYSSHTFATVSRQEYAILCLYRHNGVVYGVLSVPEPNLHCSILPSSRVEGGQLLYIFEAFLCCLY
uniref:Uncharacterized protein n=1 Tax=Octopus bimaculoides TaxID=37653 RepID=A0A0L8IDP6_OCTBM